MARSRSHRLTIRAIQGDQAGQRPSVCMTLAPGEPAGGRRLSGPAGEAERRCTSDSRRLNSFLTTA